MDQQTNKQIPTQTPADEQIGTQILVPQWHDEPTTRRHDFTTHSTNQAD
jgi:hypothetical protein